MCMNMHANLDPDLLRAFAYIAEEGSFTRAAERVGRTQSAVSMQVQRLEAILGQRVLTRGKGGSVSLTPHGRYLLDRAREVLALNEEIWRTFRAPAMNGTVRLGTPDDYALRYIPAVLRRFAQTHPSVDVDVTCSSSSPLLAKLRAGELDLALVSEGHEPGNWPSDLLWRGPLVWITSEKYSPHRLDPLPIALAAGDCAWRTAAVRALEGAGRRYRVAYTSETQAGSLTPVIAGLAVSVSPITAVPPGVRVLPAGESLPPLGDAGILLMRAREPRQPLTDALAAHIRDTFRAELERPAAA
jgi:DNA-binding transcriptional LysR family regulator